MNNLSTINEIPDLKSYQRNGRACYLDEVSKQLRIITPEETVRQKLIKFLHIKLKVPMEAMEVEVPMSYFKKGEKGRMDLVVYGMSDGVRIPVMLVECKAPSVAITDSVFQQADRYAEITGAPVVGVTNGSELHLDYWNEKEGKFQQIENLPQYDELCTPHKLKTISYAASIYERGILTHDEAVKNGIVAENTPTKYVPFLLNLYDCLMDDSEKCKKIQISGYKSVTDMGKRFATFGNASGLGGYTGFYRYFMLDDGKGNSQIAGLSMFGFGDRHTILCVAIDDYNVSHHSLQLSVEMNVIMRKNSVDIWHNGSLTVGNLGAVKRADLINYISSETDMVVDDKVFLGALDDSKLLQINSDDVSNFLSRIIKYAFLRNEYRNIVKSNKTKIRRPI